MRNEEIVSKSPVWVSWNRVIEVTECPDPQQNWGRDVSSNEVTECQPKADVSKCRLFLFQSVYPHSVIIQ